MCCYTIHVRHYKVKKKYILHRFAFPIVGMCSNDYLLFKFIYLHSVFSRMERDVLASSLPIKKNIRASIVNLHEFMCLNPQTARLYFSFGVYNFIYQFYHFCSKIFVYNNPFMGGLKDEEKQCCVPVLLGTSNFQGHCHQLCNTVGMCHFSPYGTPYTFSVITP